MQFGVWILIQRAISKGGGVHKLQILVVKNALTFSKHHRPKRCLKARLGHSKVTTRNLRSIQAQCDIGEWFYVSRLKGIWGDIFGMYVGVC